MTRRAIRTCTALASFALVAAVAAAQSAPSQGAGVAEEQVKAAQQQMLKAVHEGDKEALSRFIADSATWVKSDGTLATKQDLISAPAPAPHEVKAERVAINGNTAIVTGTARFDDGRTFRYLQDWMNQGGNWKLVAHEATVLSPSSSGSSAATPTGTTGASASMPAGGGVAPKLSSDDERAIWKANNDLQQAFLKGDAEAYGSLTTDDYLRVLADGQLQTKPEFLETVRNNAKHPGGHLETSDVRVSVDGDTARVVFTTWGTLPGGQQQAPERVTRIYEKRDGRWQQAGMAFVRIQKQ